MASTNIINGMVKFSGTEIGIEETERIMETFVPNTGVFN